MCDVESWCKVEGNPKAEYVRSERKHFPKNWASSVFGSAPSSSKREERSQWVASEKEHKHRRHFPDKRENVLGIKSSADLTFFFFIFS